VPAAEPRIVYSPRAGATPETELDVLAAVYAFLLDRHANEATARPSGPDHDAKEFERRRLCLTKKSDKSG
jgi:hypothetical protein